ncbi:hypothetical protein [Streptomyces albidoflavus]|uniref:hypothetical protein n=1 Tax=Streptomyces albidoflavus TaxID=1886 RepID=UPI00332F480A
MDLSIEQLSLGRDAGVPDERALHGGDWGEEIGGVAVRRRLHSRDRTEYGAPQVLEHIDFLTPFDGHDPTSIRPRAVAY